MNVPHSTKGPTKMKQSRPSRPPKPRVLTGFGMFWLASTVPRLAELLSWGCLTSRPYFIMLRNWAVTSVTAWEVVGLSKSAEHLDTVGCNLLTCYCSEIQHSHRTFGIFRWFNCQTWRFSVIFHHFQWFSYHFPSFSMVKIAEDIMISSLWGVSHSSPGFAGTWTPSAGVSLSPLDLEVSPKSRFMVFMENPIELNGEWLGYPLVI